MPSSPRPNQHPWITPFQLAPPSACSTLRAVSNTVAYGLHCVFAEDDTDPLPNPINTACLPWATSSLPTSAAFYSPATACPTSWTPVATRTAAEGADDWIDGETALDCCPPGFVGGGAGMCNPGTTGTIPVVRCGEADAEENENEVYTAGSWPAGVSARVTALQLRYQGSDVGGGSATGSGTFSTSTIGSSSGGGSSGGLSTGAKAAVGTVVPLVFVLGVLAAFLLWRRKQRKAGVALSKDFADGQDAKPSYEKEPHETFISSPVAVVPPQVAGATQYGHHQTPEWNAELDATEAERRRYMAVQGSLFPPANGGSDAASSPWGASEASELGGMMRVNRKPVAPVELDSTPVRVELDSTARAVREVDLR